MIRCNSICSRIKSEKVIGFHNGQKYCGSCQYYIKTGDRFCSCCRCILRTKRRNNKRRQGGVWNEKNKFDFVGIEN